MNEEWQPSTQDPPLFGFRSDPGIDGAPMRVWYPIATIEEGRNQAVRIEACDVPWVGIVVTAADGSSAAVSLTIPHAKALAAALSAAVDWI